MTGRAPRQHVLLKLGGDNVAAAGVRRHEPDGTIVLDVRHPQTLGFGRVLHISVADGDGWATTQVRIERPHFRPHQDAGMLRLAPVPGSMLPDEPDDLDEEPGTAPVYADAEEASAPARSSRPLGNLRPWQGAAPHGNVGIRLKSGRVRTMEVLRVDEEGLLVMTLKSPGALDEGDCVEIAWSERRRWLTATMAIAPNRTGTHPEAGLLRLELREGPNQQRERRSSPRVRMRLAVRGVVERSAPTLRGQRIEVSTLDVSTGGVAIATELELAAGDRLKIRLIGPGGQLPGGEFPVEVRRIEPIPGKSERRVVLIWRDPPSGLTRAVQQLVKSAG